MPDIMICSNENIYIENYAKHHDDLEKAIKLYFDRSAISFDAERFIDYNADQINIELNERLTELELSSSLTLLAAVEAAFRVDYLRRCASEGEDDVSKEFRERSRKKKRNIVMVSLGKEIFTVWKAYGERGPTIIDELESAFKYRNWLAHGRYFVHEGQKYDYATIYALADAALNSFPLLGP